MSNFCDWSVTADYDTRAKCRLICAITCQQIPKQSVYFIQTVLLLHMKNKHCDVVRLMF